MTKEDRLESWARAVYKLLNSGFDSLSEQERRDFEAFFYWILKRKVHFSLSPQERKSISETLMNETFLWMEKKRKNLEKLDKKLLLKKFMNHCSNWIQYHISGGKLYRDGQFTVLDHSWIIDHGKDPVSQDDSEKDFEREDNKFVDISELDFEAYIDPDILKEHGQENEVYEEEELRRKGRKSLHGDITIITFDEYNPSGWVKKISPPKVKKKI